MGFDLVVMAVDDVSLFSIPHTSHLKTAFSSPEDPSNRLPQSVQKTSDPMAAMAVFTDSFHSLSIVRTCNVLKQSYSNSR